MTRQEILALVDKEIAQRAPLQTKQDYSGTFIKLNRFAPYLKQLLAQTAHMDGLWSEAREKQLQREFIQAAAIAIQALEQVDVI